MFLLLRENKAILRWMLRFPDPRKMGEEDQIVLIDPSQDLSVETLVEAYGNGIFPWPAGRGAIPWFCPNPRGVLLFSDFHLPRSLKAARKISGRTFTFDKAFDRVIRACAEVPRPESAGGTWIVPEMVEAYIRLHEAGFAHSAECWRGEELVGGLYGVHVRGVFSGESMFYKEDNASKLCLVEWIEMLGARGLGWMDIQMVTPVAERLGARYVHRADYLRLLEATHAVRPPEKLFP